MQILHVHLIALLLLISSSSAAPPLVKPTTSTTRGTSPATTPSPQTATPSSPSTTPVSTPTPPPTSLSPSTTPTSGNSNTSPGGGSNTNTITTTPPPPQQTGQANETCSLEEEEGARSKNGTLSKRAAGPVTHPLGTQAGIRLFHGTSSAEAAVSIAQGVALGARAGDFNPARGEVTDRFGMQLLTSEGAFYLTDSLASAAQFACYQGDINPRRPIPPVVHVVEFIWHAGVPVHEFTPQDNDLRQQFMRFNLSPRQYDAYANQAVPILQQSSMITGPMDAPGTDSELTPEFRQYAIIKQSALPNLQYHATHSNIRCRNVKRGAALSREKYTAGQGNNPQAFAQLVQRYQRQGGSSQCVVM